MPDDPSTSVTPPLLSLEDILRAVASPLRWRILAELAGGETLMVAELAERVGANADTVSKQLAILRAARVVSAGRNRLYRLEPQFITDKDQRLVDFGWCLLRLKTGR